MHGGRAPSPRACFLHPPAHASRACPTAHYLLRNPGKPGFRGGEGRPRERSERGGWGTTLAPTSRRRPHPDPSPPLALLVGEGNSTSSLPHRRSSDSTSACPHIPRADSPEPACFASSQSPCCSRPAPAPPSRKTPSSRRRALGAVALRAAAARWRAGAARDAARADCLAQSAVHAGDAANRPPVEVPGGPSNFSNKVERCIEAGTAAGVGPNHIGNFTSRCAN